MVDRITGTKASAFAPKENILSEKERQAAIKEAEAKALQRKREKAASGQWQDHCDLNEMNKAARKIQKDMAKPKLATVPPKPANPQFLKKAK